VLETQARVKLPRNDTMDFAPIDCLGVAHTVQRWLEKAGIGTVGALVDYLNSGKKIEAVNGMGGHQRAAQNVVEKLCRYLHLDIDARA
jgi:hypothetical protein